ncbi:TPA: hypothetical protein DCX15_05805 [bacterium]|nr:hypothetical protein [bacterium]
MTEEREDLGLALQRLAGLYQISRVLLSSIKLDKLLKMILDEVITHLRADTGSIMLLDGETEELSIKVARGLDAEIVKTFRTKIGRGISGIVAKMKRPYLLLSGELPEEFKDIQPRKGIRSSLCVPVLFLNELVGIISLCRTKTIEDFNEDDLKVLWIFAGQAGQAITNARFYEELEKKVEERTRELEEANERLKELDRLKDSFIDTASHELRTPLSSIKSYTEILLTQDVDKSTSLEFLRIINHEADRLTRLVNNLLSIPAIEGGMIIFKMTEVDLVHEVISRAISLIQPIAEEKEIKIVSDIQDGLPKVKGNKDALIQVVENLLDNAVKFTHQGGQIEVRAYEQDDTVQVSVRDSGVGIKKEDFEQIFEKFSQVRKRPKGMGLGLSICQEVVKQHQGRIWVESKLGQGSTFHFTLPKG